jgi:carbon starvation protein
VAEIVREHVGGRAYKFFVAFVWLSLVYVITAFTDITSASFVEPQFGGGVATASTAYLLIGWPWDGRSTKARVPLWLATVIALPWSARPSLGANRFPLQFPAPDGFDLNWRGTSSSWDIVLLPPSFLFGFWFNPGVIWAGYFLYGTLLAGIVGLISGRR